MVNMGAEKMSKSLGNTLWIREILKRYDAGAVRFWVLGTHYRNPLEYAEERLAEAARALDRLWGPVRDARTNTEWKSIEVVDAIAARSSAEDVPEEFRPFREEFVRAMDDDFNTPQALGVLFEMTRVLNRREGRSVQDQVGGARALMAMLLALGLTEPKPVASEMPAALNDRIVGLIRARAAARASRDWKRADELRAELATLDVAVKDTPRGTDWEWKGLRATEPA
jgi:cysteinyl-tRNA synthetase